MPTGDMDRHLSLYAYDVVIFLSQPEQSLPFLLDIVKSFGEIAGYKINWQKSELMLLGDNRKSKLIFKLNVHVKV